MKKVKGYKMGVIIAAIVVVIAVALAISLSRNPAKTPVNNTGAGGAAEEVQPEIVYQGKLIGDAKCVDGTSVSITLVNVEGSPLNVDSVSFYVNSAIDRTPGCGKTVLNSGESTVCTGLDAIKLGATPSIAVKTASGTRDTAKLVC